MCRSLGLQRRTRSYSHYSGNASLESSVTNLLNTVVGAGMLAMPYAFKCNGVFLGLIMLIVAAVTSGTGLYLQARCAGYIDPGHASFFTLAQLTYPNLAIVFDLAIAIKCFGVAVSYLIIVADLMPQIVRSFSFNLISSNLDQQMEIQEHLHQLHQIVDDSLSQNPYDLSSMASSKMGLLNGSPDGSIEESILLQREFWITISIIILIPLSFMRKLDSLRYTSIISVLSAVYLVLIVVIHFIVSDIPSELRGPVRIFSPQSFTSVLSALPVIVFAFTCHQNMFSIVNEIHDKSMRSLTRMLGSTVSLAASFYIILGLCGYFTYGDAVSGNIVAMYPQSTSATIARMAIVILVLFSYPLQCHPCRTSLNHIIYWLKNRHNISNINNINNKNNINNNNNNTSNNINSNIINNNISPTLPSNSNSNVVPSVVSSTVISQPVIASNSTTSVSASTLLSSPLLLSSSTPLVPNSNIGVPPTGVPLHTGRFFLLTCFIMILSYITALSVTSLETMLAFVGSTGSTSISFILPGIFGYKLLGNLPLAEAKRSDDEESATALYYRSTSSSSSPPQQQLDGSLSNSFFGNGDSSLPLHIPSNGIFNRLRIFLSTLSCIRLVSLGLVLWGFLVMFLSLSTAIFVSK